MVDACSCKDIALFDVVHRADPATLVSSWQFKHRFALAGVPEIDGPVLAGSDKSLQIDSTHSVDGVIMTFEDYFGLFFGLPCDDLPIEARSNEIAAVEAIDVKHFCSVLVEGFDESSLREIPLLESEVSTDGAKIIGVEAELDPIDRVLMSAQSVDELQGPRIPQFDHTVISGRRQYVLIAVQTDGEDIATVVIAVLAQADELLLLGLAVPLYNALVLRARVNVPAGDLEASYAQRVALVLLSLCEALRRV